MLQGKFLRDHKKFRLHLQFRTQILDQKTHLFGRAGAIYLDVLFFDADARYQQKRLPYLSEQPVYRLCAVGKLKRPEVDDP